MGEIHHKTADVVKSTRPKAQDLPRKLRQIFIKEVDQYSATHYEWAICVEKYT
jgi:hypothetical protein